MIWLVLRVLLFALFLAVLAVGGAFLVDSPGRVAIAWRGIEYPPLTHLEFFAVVAVVMVGLVLLYKLMGLGIALVKFMLGDETALTRLWARSKEKRGLEALSRGMIALAEGETDAAELHARKAAKLLGDNPLAPLLTAQIAEARGDAEAARAQYRLLARDPRTAVVGVKGLLGQAVRRGELDKAMKLAEHALTLKPKDRGVQQGLFELQVRRRDWDGAHKTLEAMVKARTLPEDVVRRRLAVLDYEAARATLQAGDRTEALALAEDAVAEAPTFAPAAALAARLLAEEGQARKAQRVLRDAWSEAPHPDLAEVWAGFEPGETPAARRRRFRELVSANPDHAESRLLDAELALAEEDIPGARRAMGDLAERSPTHRSLALMAAIEKAAGSPESLVRGYLARAVSAPRGAHWHCDRCGAAPGGWSAVCPACGGFDTLAWGEPQGVQPPAGMDAALLPLLAEEARAADAAEHATERA